VAVELGPGGPLGLLCDPDPKRCFGEDRTGSAGGLVGRCRFVLQALGFGESIRSASIR
jgi:hypothetical protein